MTEYTWSSTISDAAFSPYFTAASAARSWTYSTSYIPHFIFDQQLNIIKNSKEGEEEEVKMIQTENGTRFGFRITKVQFNSFCDYLKKIGWKIFELNSKTDTKCIDVHTNCPTYNNELSDIFNASKCNELNKFAQIINNQFFFYFPICEERKKSSSQPLVDKEVLASTISEIAIELEKKNA